MGFMVEQTFPSKIMSDTLQAIYQRNVDIDILKVRKDFRRLEIFLVKEGLTPMELAHEKLARNHVALMPKKQDAKEMLKDVMDQALLHKTGLRRHRRMAIKYLMPLKTKVDHASGVDTISQQAAAAHGLTPSSTAQPAVAAAAPAHQAGRHLGASEGAAADGQAPSAGRLQTSKSGSFISGWFGRRGQATPSPASATELVAQPGVGPLPAPRRGAAPSAGSALSSAAGSPMQPLSAESSAADVPGRGRGLSVTRQRRSLVEGNAAPPGKGLSKSSSRALKASTFTLPAGPPLGRKGGHRSSGKRGSPGGRAEEDQDALMMSVRAEIQSMKQLDQEASTAGTSSPGSGSSGSPKRAGRRAGQLGSLGNSWEPDQVKALERGWTNLAYKPVPELKAEPSKEGLVSRPMEDDYARIKRLNAERDAIAARKARHEEAKREAEAVHRRRQGEAAAAARHAAVEEAARRRAEQERLRQSFAEETQRQFKETILQTKRRPPVFQVLEERGRAQQAALEAERRQRWEESTAPKRFWYSDIKDSLPRPPPRKAPVVTETAPYSTHWGQHSALGDLHSQREGMQDMSAGEQTRSWAQMLHTLHRPGARQLEAGNTPPRDNRSKPKWNSSNKGQPGLERRLQYHRMVDSGNSPITSLTNGGLEEGAGYRDPSPRGVQQAKPSQEPQPTSGLEPSPQPSMTKSELAQLLAEGGHPAWLLHRAQQPAGGSGSSAAAVGAGVRAVQRGAGGVHGTSGCYAIPSQSQIDMLLPSNPPGCTRVESIHRWGDTRHRGAPVLIPTQSDVERLDDGSSTMQQLPRRPSDNFEVEQGTVALLARPAEVPPEDVDDVQGPSLGAADGAEEVLKTARVSAHLSVGRPAHQMAEQPQQPMQIDKGAGELQQAAASAPEMYPHEYAVDSPLSAQQSRSTVSDTGPEGSLLAAPGTESPRVVQEPGSSP
eukprot:jgi/Astpho2/8637/fgenesh1_pg.00126_%23_41_t